MPVKIFEGPKISKEQKERLVKEFATAASNVTSIPIEKFVTLIKELEPENVGTGTDLLVNRG